MSCDNCRFHEGRYCNADINKDRDEMVKNGCINPPGTKYTIEDFNGAIDAYNLFKRV